MYTIAMKKVNTNKISGFKKEFRPLKAEVPVVREE